jgi:hypothetical protein
MKADAHLRKALSELKELRLRARPESSMLDEPIHHVERALSQVEKGTKS